MPPLNLSDLLLKTNLAWPPIAMPSEPEWAVKSDQELIKRIQDPHDKHREMAWIELYNRHFLELWRYINHLTFSDEQAKDVWGITWELAMRELPNAAKFTYMDKQVIAWLKRVASNHVKKSQAGYTQREKLVQRLKPTINALDLSDVETEALELIIQGKNRGHLMQALKQLKEKNERQYHVLLKKFYSDMDYNEIAALLKISNESARQDASRGLKELQRIFKAMGVYHE